MSENTNRVEPHGCIVCGRLYNLLVVVSPSGRLVGCTLTSPGGRIVPDDTRPLVACSHHSAQELTRALARHYPGSAQPEDEEE